MKKRKIIIRMIILGVVGVFLGLSIYTWNAKKVVGNEMPMPLGFGMSVVLSGSMEPTLSVNDLVFIKKTKEIKVGDIVVYQDGRSLVIHRVIELKEDTLITQGDANNTADEEIQIENVKGKMAFKIPFIGMIFHILKEPLVILLIAVIALILIKLSYQKEQDEDSEELEKIKKEIKDLAKELKK